MLESADSIRDDPVMRDLAHYVGGLLHDRLLVGRYERGKGLPSFLFHFYNLYEGHILGRRCVFVVAGKRRLPPENIAKHVQLVGQQDNAITILVVPTMSSYMRDRLMRYGTAFINPHAQFFVPEMGIILGERFQRTQVGKPVALPPTAQAVLFHHLLRIDENENTAKLLCRRLRCSPMSIGRAFDSLEAMNLATIKKQGRERRIHFDGNRRELFDGALQHCQSPIRTRKFVRGPEPMRTAHSTGGLILAGESALSELTNLSPPHTGNFAVDARKWKYVSESMNFEDAEDEHEADFIIETWDRDPTCLSNGHVVDPLTLHVQFHAHGDARVEQAAHELLEQIEW